ncbi:MAG TPA: hypothetical protein VFT65_06805 [Candidatus Angelobacter sp.]|nr:hypothetical protein [Candidatus Angelobacter sp.]
MSKLKTVLLITIFSSFAICASRERTTNPSSTDEQSVRKFLQTKAEDQETRYLIVFRDLNGDGVPEALAYLVGNEWCGSGGCNLFILRKSGNSWSVVNSVTITHPPVRVLDSVSNGWHNLAVEVGGGGIRGDYEAELRFNGRRYPFNPTVPPARKAGKGASGQVVIASWADARPLY